MKKITFIFLFLLTISFVHAQTNISGFINIQDVDLWESKISLFQINLLEENGMENNHFLGTVPIEENGFFAFDNSLLENKNQIYKLIVERKDGQPSDVSNSKYFILNNSDSLYFEKGSQLFGNYVSSNLADLEWQRLNQLESNFNTQNHLAFQKKYKQFARDSLQILLVKLISIKQLDDKKLLEKDIEENQAYYLDLLEEFKTSDLDPTEYARLEKKLAWLTVEHVQQKYQMSMLWNGISLFVIFGLVIVFFVMKKNTKKQLAITIPSLSKQEEVIKNLILEGKSNKEIASELFISISTVKTHLTNLYKKLGVAGRHEILSGGD